PIFTKRPYTQVLVMDTSSKENSSQDLLQQTSSIRLFFEPTTLPDAFATYSTT
ncbi:39466_t:CDS:1, partial [Gigaspora margarita]